MRLRMEDVVSAMNEGLSGEKAEHNLRKNTYILLDPACDFHA
jgi:hypothetical protein